MKNTLIAILAFAFTLAVGDHVPYETYWLMSGSQVTFAWDPIDHPGGPVTYRWENYSPVRQKTMAKGSTQQTQAAFTVFTGHNVLNIQSCADVDGQEECSVFNLSTDAAAALVDGVAKGWWVFGVIGAPGPIDPVS